MKAGAFLGEVRMIALLLVAPFQGGAPVSSMVAANAPKRVVTEKADENGIVCRKEAVLGSRLKTKVCMRAGDAQQRAIDDRDLVEKAQVLQTIRDPAAGPPP